MSSTSSPTFVYAVSAVIAAVRGCREYSSVFGACTTLENARILARELLDDDKGIARVFISKRELNCEWTIDETDEDTLLVIDNKNVLLDNTSGTE